MTAQQIAAQPEVRRVPVTALVPTISGWPQVRPALDHLVGQTLAAGGEVLVVDGSGNEPPAGEIEDFGTRVRWMSMPGQSVFQLRLAGYRAAGGEVVAVTEDHCHVAPDWIERMMDAHRRHPDAGAVGGAVLNGTDTRIVDWAAFFLTQGPHMPPLATGVAERISGPANVSYKSRVLSRLGGDDEQGVIDFLELPAALAGEDLVADDSIRVVHHQSQGFWRTSLAEFDNGRTIAGYRRRHMERGDWLRILGSPVLPVYRSIRVLRIVSRKHRPARMLLKAAPTLVWFQYSAMAGELLGYATGPGGSPHRLY